MYRGFIMALKDYYDLIFDSSVNAGTNDIQQSGVIPAGKVVRLMNFGGFDPISSDGVSSILILQWGSGTTWTTVRAGGNGFFNIDWPKGKDFIGDGVKRFRLARQNKSSSNKSLVVWLYALIL